MRITFDKNADAVVIYFSEKKEMSAFMYPCDPSEINGLINLDFNKEGKLIDIEILGASKFLPTEILENAQVISRDSELLPKIIIRNKPL
jgi:uncharacterized protein YuzE